jgi:hypothetical protein
MPLRKDTVALRVRPRDGLKFFRRAGIRFPLQGNAPEASATVLRVDSLRPDQIQALLNEHGKNIHIEELDFVPEGEIQLTLEGLAARVAELEAEVAALKGGGKKTGKDKAATAAA